MRWSAIACGGVCQYAFVGLGCGSPTGIFDAVMTVELMRTIAKS